MKRYWPFLYAFGVNAIPIAGAAFWGWEVFPILFFFWVENLVIGIFHLFKLLLGGSWSPLSIIGRLFITLFFLVHYGIFTTVHGAFVMTLFDRSKSSSSPNPYRELAHQISTEPLMAMGVTLLVLTYAVETVRGIQQLKAFPKDPGSIMAEPYSRIAVLHLVLILGGFLITILHQPWIALVLLTLGKAILDLRLKKPNFSLNDRRTATI